MANVTHARTVRTLTSLSQLLRCQTRPEHDRVDMAYSHFDLADRDGYGRFLTTHARILPSVEAALRPGDLIEDWVGRTEALFADLNAMALPIPQVIPYEAPQTPGARWGAIYVLEGSRLGGAFLSRRIRPGLPYAFLRAAHAEGSWRTLLGMLDGLAHDDHADAIAGARATFAAFIRAATPKQALQAEPITGSER